MEEMNRILIIDDDPMIRSMLTRVLQKQGYVVNTAENGQDGLLKFEECRPQLILLDLKMPVMGGIEFLQKLGTDNEPDHSVIVLTGDGTEQDAEECYSLGIHAFQRKPVEIVELKGLIRRSFDMLQSRTEIHELNSCLEQKVKERTIELEKEVEQHRQTADELKKLSRAVQQTSSMVMITDLDGNIEYLNPAFLRITGYDSTELLGKKPSVFKSNLHDESSYRELWNTILDGLEWKGDMQNKKKNGDVFWVSESISPVRDGDEKITHFVAVFEDITDKKEAEEALKVANELIIESYHDLDRLTKTFRLFVPAQLLERIQSYGQEIHSGHSSEEKLTVLFSDIRGFTQISERLSSAQSFELLSSYLNAMEPCITKYNGFIDKFIGDGIMALFDREDSALNALQSAIFMHVTLNKLNEERKEKEVTELHIGVGINTGSVMVGALGTKRRLDSTVVGDHVNLASRLEELTKKYKSKILISEYTEKELPAGKFLMRNIDFVKVRGRSTPVSIYEVFECDNEYDKVKKSETKALLEEGIHLFQNQNFKAALNNFERCIEIYSQDVAALEYLKRCNYYLKFPPKKHNWSPASNEQENLVDHSIRRLAPRYSMTSEVNIVYSPEDLSIDAKILDLSTKGMRVESNYPIDKDKIIEIEIGFQDSDLAELSPFKDKKLIGKVVWQANNSDLGSESKWLIGVELLVIPADFNEKLNFTFKTKNPLLINP